MFVINIVRFSLIVNSFHGPSTSSKNTAKTAKRVQKLNAIFGSDSENDEVVKRVESKIEKEIEEEKERKAKESNNNNSDNDISSDGGTNKHSNDVLDITIESDFSFPTTPGKNIESNESLLKYPLLLSPIQFLPKQIFIGPNLTRISSLLQQHKIVSPLKQTPKRGSLTENRVQLSETALSDNDLAPPHTPSPSGTKRRMQSAIVCPQPKKQKRETKEESTHTHEIRRHTHTNPFRTNTSKLSEKRTHSSDARTPVKQRLGARVHAHFDRRTHTNAHHQTNTIIKQQLTSHTHEANDKPSDARIIPLNNKLIPKGVQLVIAVDANKKYTKNALKKITRNLMNQM